MIDDVLERKKQRIVLGGMVFFLFILLIVLICVFVCFTGIKNNAERLMETIRDKKYGKGTMGALTDFKWEKGYCFLPYTSKEEMEKKLGFSSGKLTDNMTNDSIRYVVFTKGKEVVCTFFTNQEKGLAFEFSEEFTPQSTVYILEEKDGRKLTMEQEKEEKKEKKEKAEKERSSKSGLKEEEIYNFLQGPKSWRQRLVWSGEWGENFYDGGSFGGFGCGLCCIANLYSTLTKYQCTPIQAYRYAKKKTDYTGGSAIEWGYLRQTLTSLGFDCGVKQKPSSYEEFQKDIADSSGTIVLVSSNASSCIWKDTPGHYVTIFVYDKETGRVFLADSGEPKRNRTWVPLKKVYKSLKTESSWQYLPIGGYDGEKDEWKHKNANGNWVQ